MRPVETTSAALSSCAIRTTPSGLLLSEEKQVLPSGLHFKVIPTVELLPLRKLQERFTEP